MASYPFQWHGCSGNTTNAWCGDQWRVATAHVVWTHLWVVLLLLLLRRCLSTSPATAALSKASSERVSATTLATGVPTVAIAGRGTVDDKGGE